MRLLRSRRLVHALIAAGVLLAVAGFHALERAGWSASPLKSVEYWFRDNILAMRGRLNVFDDRLVFVGIDSASRDQTAEDIQLYPDASPDSLHALTLMTSRCWSREIYAALCKRLLVEGKARAVIFDVLFSLPDSGDKEFQEVLEEFPNGIVVVSDWNQQALGQGRTALSWTLPTTSLLPEVSPEHRAIGYDSLIYDPDGKVRRHLYQGTCEQLAGGGVQSEQAINTPSFSLALRAAEKLGPVELKQPFQPHLFRYTGPPGTFPVIPLFHVFALWENNLKNGAPFHDKVVIVGDAWTILHDDHPTPFGRMLGAEIHLNAINALLHGAFLRELPPWTGNLLVGAAVVAAWLLTILVKKTWLRFIAFLLLGLAYLFSIKFIYDYADTIVLAFPPFLALALAGLVSFIYDFTHETLEKLRIRRTLEAYVSKDVVREVLDNPESYLSKLGGERESVALIMTDLRGFTTMSEEMDSTQLVAQLNEYLSLMVDDIFSRRGSVDKFVGDAILAVWGHVKSEGPAHDATLAVEAALLMRESLKRLNADWQKRGLRTFEMGCGVNFGEVIFGNIGSARKMEPTVIGDAVNTTSRLEGLTKDYGRDLLLGETAADLVENTYRLQFVDRVTMKGKTKPVRIYSVVSRLDAVLDPKIAAYLEAYELAHVSYSAGRLQEASALFEKCVDYAPGDALLQVYIDRCRKLIEQPSEGVWTGVHVAEHK